MYGQQIVVARRLSELVHVSIQKPGEMLSLPAPGIISKPALGDRRLNGLGLAKMTRACGM